MGIQWIDYKGKKILHVDYYGQKSNEEYFQTLDEEARILSSLETKSLVLTNFEGGRATPEYMERVKQLGRTVFSQKAERSALVGITGLKLVLLQAYIAFTGHKNIQVFRSEAAALEWLVE